MFLKHLINPNPSILLFFGFFSLIFVAIPLINFDIHVVFDHFYFPPIIVFFLSLVAPFFLSVGLNNLIYQKNILKKENILIGWVFVLLSAPITNNVKLWLPLFALLFMTKFLFSSYQKDRPFSQLYNASFILGIASFFYPSLAILLFLLVINTINYSNFSIRILIIVLLGFATPFLLSIIFSFLTNIDVPMPETSNLDRFDFSQFHHLHLSKLSWLIVLMIILLLSFNELFTWLYKKSIKSRKTFKTLIWFFFILIIISMFFGLEYLFFLLFPLSVIISNYFIYSKKRTLANVLFALLLVTSLSYRFWIVF